MFIRPLIEMLIDYGIKLIIGISFINTNKMKMKSFLKRAMMLFAALTLSAALWAQEPTRPLYALSGTVVDDEGAPLEFATVLAFVGG